MKRGIIMMRLNNPACKILVWFHTYCIKQATSNNFGFYYQPEGELNLMMARMAQLVCPLRKI